VRITAGDNGARIVFYAGERQGVPIVMHGPFVGESRDDIRRLSKLYTEGRMPRISELGRPDSPRPPSRFPLPASEATSGNRN
jgi:hypothetical protein